MKRALQFLITLALLLGTYAALIAFAPKPRVRAYANLADRNVGEAQRILFSRPSPSVVFVGSSLGARFQYHTFDGCFQNLSLAGQSALTGLGLLAGSDLHPRTVLIETNILQRDVDRSFIKDVERPLARHVAMFRAENRPVNLATSYLFSMRYPNELALVGATESSIDPRVVDLGLSLQVKGSDVLIDPATLQARIESFRSAIDRQRSVGAHVVLVEMPVHPALRQTPRAVQARSALRRAFPDLEYWDIASWTGIDPVRTRDGVHLSLSDAVRVGDAISRRLGCTEVGAKHAN
jgi:hypothetical protein